MVDSRLCHSASIGGGGGVSEARLACGNETPILVRKGCRDGVADLESGWDLLWVF